MIKRTSRPRAVKTPPPPPAKRPASHDPHRTAKAAADVEHAVLYRTATDDDRRRLAFERFTGNLRLLADADTDTAKNLEGLEALDDIFGSLAGGLHAELAALADWQGNEFFERWMDFPALAALVEAALSRDLAAFVAWCSPEILRAVQAEAGVAAGPPRLPGEACWERRADGTRIDITAIPSRGSTERARVAAAAPPSGPRPLGETAKAIANFIVAHPGSEAKVIGQGLIPVIPEGAVRKSIERNLFPRGFHHKPAEPGRGYYPPPS